MNNYDGGPAFPVAEVFDERRGETTQYGAAGMSLRDYFATHASDADVAAARQHVPTCTRVRDDGNSMKYLSHGAEPEDWRAIARYIHADMMLARRKPPNVVFSGCTQSAGKLG